MHPKPLPTHPAERPQIHANGNIPLPPSTESASDHPSASATIAKVYQNGIETIDQASAVTGMAASLGFMLLPLVILAIKMVFSHIETYGFLSAFLTLLLLFAVYLTIRLEFHGLKYEPILFNRALQQVHILEPIPLSRAEFLFMPWKMVKGVKISSYAWAATHAEITSFMVSNTKLVRREYMLVLSFTSSPWSNVVAARVGVGTTSAYDDGELCRRHWEHIRRYMRGEGPALSPNSVPWESGTETFWQSLFFGQPLLGPGKAANWGSPDLWTRIGGLVVIPALPFTAVVGLTRWLCFTVRKTPEWPAEIRQAIGPELSRAEMQRIIDQAGLETLDTSSAATPTTPATPARARIGGR